MARELRLGMGNRLIEVSRDGHYGVVQHMLTRFRQLLDLQRLNYVRVPTLASGRLCNGPRFVQLVVEWPQEPDVATTTAHVSRAMGRTEERVVSANSSPQTHWRFASGADGLLCITHSDQSVRIYDLEHGTLCVQQAPPGHVLQACDYDPQRRLLVAASYGVARLQLLGDDAVFTTLATLRLEQGDVEWCAIAGERVITIVREQAVMGTSGRIDVWSTRPPYQRISTMGFAPQWSEPNAYDCTRDGRLVAVGTRHGEHIIVFDTETEDTLSLQGHTDPINLVRFVAGDSLLITADRDNRVLFWPRTAEGLATRVIPVSMSDRYPPLPK